MDLVITGANGAVGTALLQHLSAHGPLGTTRLRALVRSQAGARALYGLDAEVIVVDYRQPALLQRAIAGAEAVVHLAGALRPRRGDTLLQANAAVTQALVKAATAAGVKTLVYLSFPGADPASRNRYLRAKGMAEASIQQGGFAGAILRVPMILGPGSPAIGTLCQMAKAPLLPLVSGGAVRLQPIAQADVLAAIVWAITMAPRPMRLLHLVGPETLTYAELLQKVCERLGTTPRRLRIPRAVAWLSAGIAGAVVPLLGWNPSVFNILFQEHLADPTEAQATLPFALTSVDATLDQSVPTLD